MKIDMNKKYRYADGSPARILCIDKPDAFGDNVVSMAEDGLLHSHKINGVYYNSDKSRNLVEIIIPKLEIDTKVTVWNSTELNRHFSHFDEDGSICCFADGTTSWSVSGNNNITKWKHWRLADD